MSRRYTDEEKTQILETLDDNYGNITLTAIQTGVPKRTLQEWKRERKLEHIKNGESFELPRTKNDAPQQQNEYTVIRDRLMDHIFKLMETLTDDPDTAHLRIAALSRLLDRVIKLEALTRTEHEQVIRIEYKYPDGVIHDCPPWKNEEYAHSQADHEIGHSRESGKM